ncbi:MAG: hypothetical protein AAFQ08_00475, partial [Bacteroidota bacterium]
MSFFNGALAFFDYFLSSKSNDLTNEVRYGVLSSSSLQKTVMPQEVNYFDIDHWIVYVFLAGILYVGLRVGRGVKDMNDYAIAGKSYGTTTLVLTFLATGFGGSSTLGTASNIFSDGIIMLIACFGACIAVLFICYYIIPRMVKPGDSISMGDLMGKFYGEDVQIFTGIIGVIYSTGIVAAQALALGFMFEA